MSMSQGWRGLSIVFLFLMAFEAIASGRAVTIQGHRGARAVLPENTIEGFKYAVDVGVDYLEMDLRMTADEEIVIYHDLSISKKLCLHGDGSPVRETLFIRSLTLEEIQAFDCGSLPHPQFKKQKPVPGAKIPSLDDLLHWLSEEPHPHAKKVKLHLEIKDDPLHPTMNPSLFAEKMVPAINSYGLLDRSIFEAHNPAYQSKSYSKAKILGQKPQDKYVYIFHLLASAPLVKFLQAIDYKVVVHTPNSPLTWKRLILMGVDSITTDDPAALKAYLAKNGD